VFDDYINYNVTMSIANIWTKIKTSIDIDKVDIMYLGIFIIVGVGSFILGRMSVLRVSTYDNSVVIISQNVADRGETQSSLALEALEGSQPNSGHVETVTGPYVASKNGSVVYYGLDCSSAKRIKEENKVYFKTLEEAKKLGYKSSTKCSD
jgi:hypothetical protein